ncbi:PAS domain-containing sensor histidine kinase [Bacillus sp. FJAT-47783]|uniref:PAS domain-containing sensor histidine kinase n=1 Tax=Bacillus sp. FJAT-47783 TaxID=2922712 RepID=UPI001FADC949|nr:PAS domain-containing sensor histidine kinase [Bacillus sp. FJAT-47783]
MKNTIHQVELISAIEQLTEENRKLKSDLNKYQVIFEQALDAIVFFDQQLNFVKVNKAACDMFHVTEEELLSRNLHDFLKLMPKEQKEEQMKRFYKMGYLQDELVINLDDGEVKFVEFTAKYKAFGEYDLSIFRDVSSRKVLERERTINEQLFQDLFNRAVDGIVIFDEEGYFVDANYSFCVSFDLNKHELNHFRLEDFVIEPTKIIEMKQTMLKEGKVKGELPVKLKNGKTKIFEFTSTANILNGFYMSILRDITEKRMMEQQLKESEERFREVFESALDAIVLWDENGKIVRANQWACRIFELPLDKLLKSRVCDFVDKNDQKFQKIKKEYMKTGAIREELLFHMPNGQKKQLEFTSKREGHDGYHMTILRNVSDRKRMEKELRESEQKFRKVFDGTMDGNVLFDDTFRIIDANPVASKIFNIPLHQLKKLHIHDIFQTENIRTLLEKGDKMPKELPFILQSGEERLIECSFKRDIIQNMNLAIFRDVTEKKEMEEKLRKSDTLNVVGELAAGIAHEIRNPMTALKGFIQLLQGSMKEDHSMYFKVITSELQRIESIITEFLILAKPQAVHFQKKNLVDIMKDTIDLLNAQAILANVQIHLDAIDTPPIYCEPNQLKQVFINILKNAIEVMPNGGNIHVRISSSNGQKVTVSIKDEGIGIPRDKLKRLGEPFYTTKERGTGLGLMVSYKIIEEHNGKVDVTSKVGNGTTFSISLPIHQDDTLNEV